MHHSVSAEKRDVLKTEGDFAFFSGHGQRTVLEALCATGAVKKKQKT